MNRSSDLPPSLEVDLTPVYIGPTWKRDENGEFILPEHTLGWHAAAWCQENLKDPRSADEEKIGWEFTPEQLRFLLWWYAVDENGEWLYNEGVFQRLKGWGKDPSIAVFSILEMIGPSRFSHFDPDTGLAIGRANPTAWVNLLAVNLAQTQNTVSIYSQILPKRTVEKYSIKLGAELTRALGGRVRSEASASSFRSLEGKRTSAGYPNEVQHWLASNGGHELYAAAKRNAAKVGGRLLSFTNAYRPGEDSIGERLRVDYERLIEQQGHAGKFLYDSIEANANTTLSEEHLRIVIPMIAGDSYWVPVERIVEEIHSGIGITPAQARRFYLNNIVSESDSLIPLQVWDQLEKVAELKEGDEVVLGFDGGKSNDSTALVGIRIRDRVAFVLGLWEKPSGEAGKGWEVDRLSVDSKIHETFRKYKVKGFYADVALWEDHIFRWGLDYGSKLKVKASAKGPIEWDMRSSQKKNTEANERLLSAVTEGSIFHDGNLSLRRHVANVNRYENSHGVSFRKDPRDHTRKIDLYAALMLAHEAYLAVTTAKKERERTGNVWFL